jgi:hypothetical protein
MSLLCVRQCGITDPIFFTLSSKHTKSRLCRQKSPYHSLPSAKSTHVPMSSLNIVRLKATIQWLYSGKCSLFSVKKIKLEANQISLLSQILIGYYFFFPHSFLEESHLRGIFSLQFIVIHFNFNSLLLFIHQYGGTLQL